MKHILAVGIAMVSLAWFMADNLATAAASDDGIQLVRDGRGGGGGGGHGGGHSGFSGGSFGGHHGGSGWSGHSGHFGSGSWGGLSSGHWTGHSGSHHGHHGHWGHYGRSYYPGYGYGYYSYPGYYSSYPYYNYGYSYPSYGYSYPLGSGTVTSGFWPDASQGSATVPPATEPVRIMNPAANNATLSFSVNGQQFSLAPGFKQDLTGGAGTVISFDRGEGRGVATYTLFGGEYTFTPTANGWELFRTSTVFPGGTGGVPGQ